jgi:ammonia channel protein AmtB
VSVTAASNNIALHSACIIGVTTVFIYSAFSRFLAWLQIDDPLEVTAVHGVSGFYGLIVVGFLD